MSRAVVGVGVVVALAAAAFISAGYVGHRARKVFGVQLDATQAQMWFDQMKAFEQIEADLARGCSDAALEQVKIDIDGKMHLLSMYVKEGGDLPTLKYMTDRDPTIISRLKSFKSKYGSAWEVPRCGGSSLTRQSSRPAGAGR